MKLARRFSARDRALRRNAVRETASELRCKWFTKNVTSWSGLQRLEQIGDAHAQPQRDAVERLDRRRVFSQLDLRQIAERDVGALGHLGKCQAERLAAFANDGAELFAQRIFREAQEAA